MTMTECPSCKQKVVWLNRDTMTCWACSEDEDDDKQVAYGCHNCLMPYMAPRDVADLNKPWVCPYCDDGIGEEMSDDDA